MAKQKYTPNFDKYPHLRPSLSRRKQNRRRNQLEKRPTRLQSSERYIYRIFEL